MLYFEIQKGKEDMKSSYFQHHIRGTAARMKIIIKANKGCGQL